MTERTIAELEDELTQGAARMDAALCSWLLVVGEFDRRAGYERWECRSTAHFLNWRCGISLHTAREQVRVARRLEELPRLRAKFAEGVLSYSKVRAISRIATPETEQTLLEWAECATAAQIDRVVAGRRSLDKKNAPERYVTWSYEDDGSFVVRAKLTAEEGALVVAALQSARKVLSDGVGEVESVPAGTSGESVPAGTPKPGNADAFVAMAETTLAHGPTPVEAGDRHVVMVHLNAETGEAHLDGGPVLSEDSKQLVLCGASFADVGLGDQREILYMGRLYREPNRAQRRALAIRDHGCTFPGCTQRIFVDAHHLEEWEHGGRTDIDNLLLLCRFHHNAIHHRGFTVKKGPRQTF
ncbi:MAG TPA: DUF222 domain-containing protein, partial [Acidimicrobiales bacterium]|nr:DUF222 domain-containing protein [Acidimicrobiales bacterium]